MTKLLGRWVVPVAVSLFAVAPVPSAAPVDGGDREVVAREVAAALSDYHRLFSSKRADEMAERGCGAPR